MRFSVTNRVMASPAAGPLTGQVIGLGCQRAAHLRSAHWAPVEVAQSYAHLATGKRGGRRRRQGEFGIVTILGADWVHLVSR